MAISQDTIDVVVRVFDLKKLDDLSRGFLTVQLAAQQAARQSLVNIAPELNKAAGAGKTLEASLSDAFAPMGEDAKDFVGALNDVSKTSQQMGTGLQQVTKGGLEKMLFTIDALAGRESMLAKQNPALAQSFQDMGRRISLAYDQITGSAKKLQSQLNATGKQLRDSAGFMAGFENRTRGAALALNAIGSAAAGALLGVSLLQGGIMGLLFSLVFVKFATIPFVAAGAAMAVTIGGLVKSLTAATTAATDAQTAIFRLTQTVGDFQGGLGAFTMAERLARDFGFAMEESLGAVNELVRAGTPMAKEMTQAAMDLSAATGKDLATSMQILTTAVGDSNGNLMALRQAGIHVTESMAKGTEAIGDGVDEMDRMARTAFVTKKVMDEFGGASTERLKTVGAQLQRLTSNLKALFAALGEPIIQDIIVPLLQRLSDFISKLVDMTKAFTRSAEFAKEWGRLLEEGKELLRALGLEGGKTGDRLRNLYFRAIILAIRATTIFIILLQKLVALFKLIGAAIRFTMPFWKALIDLIRRIIGFIKDLIDKLGGLKNLFLDIFGDLMNLITLFLARLLGLLNRVFNIDDFLKKLLNRERIRAIFRGILDDVSEFVARFRRFFASLPDDIGRLIRRLIPTFEELPDRLRFILREFDDLLRGRRSFRQFVGDMDGFFRQQLKLIDDFGRRARSAMRRAFRPIVVAPEVRIPERAILLPEITDTRHLESTSTKLRALFRNLGDEFPTIQRGTRGLSDDFARLSDNIVRLAFTFDDFVGRVVANFAGALDNLRIKVAGIGSGISKFIDDFAKGFTGDIKPIQFQQQLLDLEPQKGIKLIDDFWTKIGDALVKGALKVAKGIITLPIRLILDPGGVIGDIGRFFGELRTRIANGFRNAASDATRAMSRNFWEVLKSNIKAGVMGLVAGIVLELVGAFAISLLPVRDAVKDFLTRAWLLGVNIALLTIPLTLKAAGVALGKGLIAALVITAIEYAFGVNTIDYMTDKIVGAFTGSWKKALVLFGVAALAIVLIAAAIIFLPVTLSLALILGGLFASALIFAIVEKNKKTIFDSLKKVGGFLVDAMEAITDFVKDNWVRILVSIIAFPLTGPFMAIALSPLGPKIKGIIVDGLNSIRNFLADHWKQIVVGFLTFPLGGAILPSALAAFGPRIRDLLRDALRGISPDLYEMGVDIVEGIKGGIADAVGDLGGFFKDIGGGIIDFFKGGLGIMSPPDWSIEAGQDIVKGLTEGVDKETAEASEKMANAVASILGSIQAAIQLSPTDFEKLGELNINPLINFIEGLVRGLAAANERLDEGAAADLAEDAQKMFDLLTTATETLNALMGPLSALDYTNLDAAIQRLVDLTINIVQKLNAAVTGDIKPSDAALKFSEDATKVLDFVGQAADSLSKLSEATLPAAVQVQTFLYITTAIINWMVEAAKGMSEKALKKAKEYGEAASKIFESVDKAADALKKIREAGEVTADHFENFRDNILRAVALFATLVQNAWFREMLGASRDFFEIAGDFFDNIDEAADSINGIRELGQSIFDDITDFAAKVTGTLFPLTSAKANLERGGDLIVEGFRNFRNKVFGSLFPLNEVLNAVRPGGLLRRAWDDIQREVGRFLGEPMTNAGRDMARGLLQGAFDYLQTGEATETVRRLVFWLERVIRIQLGAHSPSDVFARVGESIPQGLLKGIMSGDLSGATGLVDGLQTAVAGSLTGALGDAATAWETMSDRMVAAIDRITAHVLLAVSALNGLSGVRGIESFNIPVGPTAGGSQQVIIQISDSVVTTEAAMDQLVDKISHKLGSRVGRRSSFILA